jgi:hypothetical protein
MIDLFFIVYQSYSDFDGERSIIFFGKNELLHL